MCRGGTTYLSVSLGSHSSLGLAGPQCLAHCIESNYMSDSPPDTIASVNSFICSFIHSMHIDGNFSVTGVVLGFGGRTKSKTDPVPVLLKLLF